MKFKSFQTLNFWELGQGKTTGVTKYQKILPQVANFIRSISQNIDHYLKSTYNNVIIHTATMAND